MGKLYLEQLPDGTYSKVWWNGMEEDPVTSNPLPLPSCEEPGPDAGVEPDAGLDGGVITDGEAPDASVADPDASVADPDASVVDAASLHDGGTVDSGAVDPSTPDRGCNCSAAPGSSARGSLPVGLAVGLLIGLFLGILRRRPGR